MLWKRLTTETSHHRNTSRKRTHKTYLKFSSLNLKLERLYSNNFHNHEPSARPLACPSRSS